MAGDAPTRHDGPRHAAGAEIQFAQRLASHEKGIRDRAVKKLRQYISVKTQKETGGRRRSAAPHAARRGEPGWAGWGVVGRGPVGRCVTGDGPGEPRAEPGRACGTESHSACAFVSAFCWVSSCSKVEGLWPTMSGGLLKVTVGGEA